MPPTMRFNAYQYRRNQRGTIAPGSHELEFFIGYVVMDCLGICAKVQSCSPYVSDSYDQDQAPMVRPGCTPGTHISSSSYRQPWTTTIRTSAVFHFVCIAAPAQDLPPALPLKLPPCISHDLFCTPCKHQADVFCLTLIHHGDPSPTANTFLCSSFQWRSCETRHTLDDKRA